MNFWTLKWPQTRLALIDDAGRQWSYADLACDVARFNDALPSSSHKQLGFILCENTAAIVTAYLAALQRGDAVCLLDAKLDPTLLDGLLEVYRPDWIIAPTGHPGRFAGSALSVQDYQIYVAEPRNGPADALAIHPDLAVLLPTSGTTGNPKLVRLSYKNIQANAESIATYLELSDTERPITTLPMHYSYGMSIVNSHLQVGATLLLTNHSIIERPFWDFFKEHQATSLAGVPYTYQMLHRMDLPKMDVASLRTMTQAGGRLDPKYVHYFASVARENGWKFYVMYGQTEASPRMSYVPPDRLIEKVGSIGIPIPGGSFRIEETGELVYKGVNVMMGYAEDRGDLARADDMQGVLHTGDLARQDSDGFYYLTGRMNRFLKLFGLRINLDDVERLLEAKIQIPVACTGTDEKLWVFVEQGEMTDTIRQELARAYSLHHSAYQVQPIPAIPRNTNGKVSYTDLKKLVTP